MDAAAKAQLEKRAVIGLAVVFLVVLVRGPMKSLGFFQAKAGLPSVEPVPKVTVAKSVGGMLREGWDKLDYKIDTLAPKESDSPMPVDAAYSASGLRDPLKSLLPKPTPAELAGEAAPPVKEPPPPPAITIQGLVWGGSEPQAIIGGKLYRVNDTVDGAKILSIQRGGITIEHLGKPVAYSTAAAPQ
jgi:hypothetical protein